jgi:hypothetical protein
MEMKKGLFTAADMLTVKAGHNALTASAMSCAQRQQQQRRQLSRSSAAAAPAAAARPHTAQQWPPADFLQVAHRGPPMQRQVQALRPPHLECVICSGVSGVKQTVNNGALLSGHLQAVQQGQEGSRSIGKACQARKPGRAAKVQQMYCAGTRSRMTAAAGRGAAASM